MRKTLVSGLTLGIAVIGVALLSPPAPDIAGEQAESLFAGWAKEYAGLDIYRRTPIRMVFLKGLSERFTRGEGTVEIDFGSGRIEIATQHLAPPPLGSRYEVWLVDGRDAPGRGAAIDPGANGDRILRLGDLSPDGRLTARVDVAELDGRMVDWAAVMRVGADAAPALAIGGMQSIVFKLNREARRQAERPGIVLMGPGGVPGPPAGGGGGKDLQARIARGRDLFLNGTFAGNGRTCATCHREENDFLIDSDFIATLPASDPLFLAELTPAEQAARGLDLPAFDPADPKRPAFEDPTLMRSRGLILENINGFETGLDGQLVQDPVFRSSPTLFNMEFTSPFGLSGGFADLRSFTIGAVIQHFTRSLARVPGTDFVLPTTAQLDDIEAFLLSLRSPADGNFAISGARSILSTKADRKATDTSRPEVRGRDRFFAVGCGSCHGGTVLAGGNRNTNIEGLPANATLPTIDRGDGAGQFQTPQLFALRKPAFFHNNPIGNATTPLPGRTLQFTNLRRAVEFYESDTFAAVHARLIMTDQDKDDITAFLVAISAR